jgi:hypothetical protein
MHSPLSARPFRARPLLVAWILLLACSAGDEGPGERPDSPDAWKDQRARLDATVWADERLAQEHERTLVALWDALLEADRREERTRKAAILASVDFDSLQLGSSRRLETLDHGIRVSALDASPRTLNLRQWSNLLKRLSAGGMRLVQSEWHHARFTPSRDGEAARSQVAMVLHLTHEADDRRMIVDGLLDVVWSDRRDARGNPLPATIDATGLRMLERTGPPAFERILRYEWRKRRRLSAIQPVLLYDLNRDGLPEIAMVGCARVLWNRGDGRFEDEPLVEVPYAFTETGVIADLDGDSHPDFLSTRARGDLVLYRGDGEGGFSGEPVVTAAFETPLRAPSVLSVGEVDGDGDLDVWLAQYKPSYHDGQMPTPYYDANDGYPSYLLLNDGGGNLSPATLEAGLADKRFRRTYASALVDLDEDDDLDLLVVSDFSGIDLYRNDGAGHFTDITDTLEADRHLFGMSASFGDFDLDGELDFFVAGMASTTARRLEAMGLRRDDRPEIHEMRMRMAFGNRMYLAGDGTWREPDFREQVNRTGWTWGTTTLDFDNDGDPDLFAANGHRSGTTTNDYCSNFWCHDIYDGASEENDGLNALFGEAIRGLSGGDMSWDGYQKNQLLMNRGGRGFVNVAFLLGVADEFDSRSAVSADLDRDGRMDLVVVEDQGIEGQRLHVYRNRMQTPHHWIGVELQEEGGGVSPVGASVTVHAGERTHVGRIVTGETVTGQHPTTLHFGLGESDRVDSIEVRWVDGTTRVLHAPGVDRYHRVLRARRPG